MDNEKIKVVVVDDHALFRMGICGALSSDDSIEVIGQAGNGKELLKLMSENIIPDIVLLDIIMPEMSGEEAAKEIIKLYPDVKILILSSESTQEIICELLDLGVSGFLSKLTEKQQLIKAIKHVRSGEIYLGDYIADILSKIVAHKKEDKTNSWKEIKFSSREIEIISCSVEGLSSQETADKLSLSKRTVDWHRSKIFSKIGIHSNVELVKYAIKNQLISL